MEKLFFDFASESRLGIIRELNKQSLRMNELARKLDLTATEAARQLQRLTEAHIVQKLPDGTYAITNYTRLTLQLLPSLEFTFENKEYFEDHDIRRLPYQFISRIGELSKSTLSMETIENINLSGRIINEAEKYVWLMGEKPMESHDPAISGQASKGVRFKLMYHDCSFPNYTPVPGEAPRIEMRTLDEIPGIILCTEKEAGVCLPSTDGRMDYAGFYSKDQMFINWAKDLFLHFWDNGKPCYLM